MLRIIHTADVHLGARAGDIAPGMEVRAPVDLTIRAGEGTIQIKGTARVDPPGFAGNLLVKTLSLPELIKISGAVPESPLQSAKLDVDLGIEADLGQAREVIERHGLEANVVTFESHRLDPGTAGHAASLPVTPFRRMPAP